MKTREAISNISDKLKDSAREAEGHLREAAGAVSEGVRESAGIAADSARHARANLMDAAEAHAADAKAIGKDAYRHAGSALAQVDSLVARNPVGALVAALGLGLVLGMMARK